MMSVSVIIPTYNRGPFVCEAVASALSQTQPPFEVIVVDDGSTDNTRELLRQRYGDQIIYLYQENKGRSYARNKGAEVAQGDVIAFLDSDDLWLPTKLEKQIPLFQEDPEVALVGCFTNVIDERGMPQDDLTRFHHLHHWRAYKQGYSYEALSLECIMFPSCVVVKRDVYRSVGGSDALLEALEDWDLWLRITLSHKFVVVPEPLVLYRCHGGQWGSQALTRGRIQVCKKHLSLLESVFSNQPFYRRACRNFSIHLGECYFIQGNYLEARRWLWKAVRLDPSLLFRPIWGRHFLFPHLFLSSLSPKVVSKIVHLKRRISRGRPLYGE